LENSKSEPSLKKKKKNKKEEEEEVTLQLGNCSHLQLILAEILRSWGVICGKLSVHLSFYHK
jgi:hypothetical protein